jgi:hypothetical protein
MAREVRECRRRFAYGLEIIRSYRERIAWFRALKEFAAENKKGRVSGDEKFHRRSPGPLRTCELSFPLPQ